MHLFLPSIACKEVVGQRVGARGAVAGPFGDELMCAQLPGDSWRWRHDEVKLCLMNICNDSKIRADAEVFDSSEISFLLSLSNREESSSTAVRGWASPLTCSSECQLLME